MLTFDYLKKFYQVDQQDLARLMSTLLHQDPLDFLLHPNHEYFFHPRDVRKFERLSNGEPLSKIIKRKGFWKYEFYVNNHVLDPRPESETLVSVALKYTLDRNKKLMVCDLGCGSGNLLLSYLLECPNAVGYGVDISERALKVSNINMLRLHAEQRVKLILSNWGMHINQTFDVIFCNPPYVRPGEGDPSIRYDPPLALYADKTGLSAYKQVFQQIPKLLKKNGVAIFELSCYLVEEIVMAVPKNLTVLEIVNDYSGNFRALVIQHAKENTKKTS